MKEARLDNELQRIYIRFPFLWEEHNYRIRYFTKDYGMHQAGFIIGLENDVCKLVFKKETDSPAEPITEYIGKKTAFFKLDHGDYYLQDGWYPLTGLIFWLTGIKYQYGKDPEQDLENVSQYLQPHMDKILDLFKLPDEVDKKLKYYRNLYKENQISVGQIQEERSRLQALRQYSSLEATISSLRGGKK